MKQGGIFDMDGLIFDTERIYFRIWQQLAQEKGKVLGPEFIRSVSGSRGAHMFHLVEKYIPGTDGKETALRFKALAEKATGKYAPLKPGVHEILQYLKANGVRLVLASSSPEETVMRYLRGAGLEEYFDQILSGERTAKGKPAPDIFLAAAEAIGLSPARCYVFEDSYNGVRAGNAAGAFTVMIPDLVPPDEEMVRLADKICGSLSEAKKRIEAGEF